MKWKCSKCNTDNVNTYICRKCGADESKNYMHYALLTVLQEEDKASLKKMFSSKIWEKTNSHNYDMKNGTNINKCNVQNMKNIEIRIKWKCMNCQTENKDTYICKKCGFDESRDYARYSSLVILQQKDKVNFKTMLFKGDNILMSCSDTEFVFGRKMDRTQIKSIHIFNTLSSADKSAWDVSENKDKSVLAWIRTDQNGWDHLNLASEGDIIANKNCSGLLKKYSNLLYIEGMNHLNTAKVESMAGMFEGCTRLETLDFTRFNTENVTTMSGMFEYCVSLKKLELGHFHTLKVVDMSRMFANCVGLENLNVSSFRTENVRNMEHMFERCEKLLQLDVSTFDTSKVTNMEGMFKACRSLTVLKIEKFKTMNVTNMGAMFEGCRRLTVLRVENFNTANVTDMNNMFKDCINLKKVLNVSNFDTTNVTNMNNMFTGVSSRVKILGCNKLDKRNVRVKETFHKGDNILMKCWSDEVFGRKIDKTKIKRILIFDTLLSANAAAWDISAHKDRSVVAWMKDSEDGMKQLYLAANGNIIANEDSSGLFSEYRNLRCIEGLQYLDTKNVKDMARMFADCRNLEKINLGNFNTQNVTDMTEMFGLCENLKELDLSSFNTQNVTDMRDMFLDCQRLEELNVRGFDTRNVTSMQAMFSACCSLQKIDLSSFDTKNVTDMSYMFMNCEKLQKVDMSNFDTRNVTNMEAMFAGVKAYKNSSLILIKKK